MRLDVIGGRGRSTRAGRGPPKGARPDGAPGRREIAAAATALVARHGAQILATARRYAATPEDAEDAYQRGLEILLRKAPTTREYELVPWLKTWSSALFALRTPHVRSYPRLSAST